MNERTTTHIRILMGISVGVNEPEMLHSELLLPFLCAEAISHPLFTSTKAGGIYLLPPKFVYFYVA